MFEIKEKLDINKIRCNIKKHIKEAKKLNRKIRNNTWKPTKNVDIY